MHASEVWRAVAAARSSASTLNLMVDDVIVLQDANRLVVHLLPWDIAHVPEGALFADVLWPRISSFLYTQY